jgi:hypothetical protein
MRRGRTAWHERVPASPGGDGIDRSQPLTFRYNGRTMQGFAGDTLASALLANGVSIVGAASSTTARAA